MRRTRSAYDDVGGANVRQTVMVEAMVKKSSAGAKSKEQMATALDRWEGEGGAQTTPWALRYEGSTLADSDRQVLECLGAAVVSLWNDLPTDVQRSIFQHIALNRAYDAVKLTAKIARFIHVHKDDT
jgi:hypothetical protein